MGFKINIMYTCPMHPEVQKTEPGKCPGCGMDLILKKVDVHADHEARMTNPARAKKMEADMSRRFWISFLLTIPIFLYSPIGINILKINLPSPIPINWLMFILTTPIV